MNSLSQQSDVQPTDNESSWLEVFSPSRSSFLEASFDSPYDIAPDGISRQDNTRVVIKPTDDDTRRGCLPAPTVSGDERITRDALILKHDRAPLSSVFTQRSQKSTATLPASTRSDRGRCIRCIVQKKKVCRQQLTAWERG